MLRFTPLLLVIACAPPSEAPPDPPAAVASLYAPHVSDGRFFNPWKPVSRGGPLDIVRWWFSRNLHGEASESVPVVENDGSSFGRIPAQPRLTWVGHATIAIQDGANVLLTDPHFGDDALLPRRQTPPGIPVEALGRTPGRVVAVVSHNHYDHLDAESVERLPPDTAWFVPLGLADWFRSLGVRDVVELDWWASGSAGEWRIHCLPSQHQSRRIGQAENETLWCSWLVETEAHRYFFAGDTGYFHGFAEFGRRFAPIDVALLPIGSYEPRWFMRDSHMNPREAYAAFRDLGARYMIPIHWGAFDITDEPLDLPPRRFREVVAENGGDPLRSPVLAVGEAWSLPVDGAIDRIASDASPR